MAVMEKALDLTKTFPRSPNDLLGGYVILSRTLDKTRAAIAGTAGEYHWDCGLAMMFFNFKGIDPKAFYDELATGKTDEQMLDWVNKNGRQVSEEEILAWSYDSRWARPDSVEKKAYVEKTLREAKIELPYAVSFFQMLDAEEGRLKF